MKTLIWQNCTEGPMTQELKNADMVLLCEGAPWLTRVGRGIRRTKQHRNKRLKGLVINWDKEEFVAVEKGHRMFHKSGKAEGWNGIRTPARGILFVIGYWKDDPNKRLYMYAVTHWLNSWLPAGKPDRWTFQRNTIVTETTIPVVEELVEDKKRVGAVFNGQRVDLEGGLVGGDTNSLPWDGDLIGLRHVDNRGLDRIWKFGRVAVDYIGHTPKTGRGPQMKHHGEKVKQDIQGKKAS